MSFSTKTIFWRDDQLRGLLVANKWDLVGDVTNTIAKNGCGDRLQFHGL
jgi:hypothetical protein